MHLLMMDAIDYPAWYKRVVASFSTISIPQPSVPPVAPTSIQLIQPQPPQQSSKPSKKRKPPPPPPPVAAATSIPSSPLNKKKPPHEPPSLQTLLIPSS